MMTGTMALLYFRVSGLSSSRGDWLTVEGRQLIQFTWTVNGSSYALFSLCAAGVHLHLFLFCLLGQRRIFGYRVEMSKVIIEDVPASFCWKVYYAICFSNLGE